MMTKTSILTAALTALMRPALGVMPPSLNALHSSMRLAPPFSAAIADSTESTQISRFMVGVPILSAVATKSMVLIQIIVKSNSAA
jgi:hypothetical protein